jgi:hypothetical protein
MMQRLAHAAKPTRSFLDKQRRWLNKKLGRPATQDVGTLSEMILSLKTATEEEIKRSMDRVVVAVPLLPALTDEDIDDALEYSRLRTIMINGVTSRLGEADALFAANGKGLCKKHKNNFECDDEAEGWPLHQVFTVSFSQNELYTSIAPFVQAFHYYEDVHFIDFDSGLRSVIETPGGSWAHVRQQIEALPRRVREDGEPGWARRPITMVQIHGDSAGDLGFREVLKEALGNIVGFPTEVNDALLDQVAIPNVEIEVVADTTFGPARGAALYARWKQETQDTCKEDEERCSREREKERHGRMDRLVVQKHNELV